MFLTNIEPVVVVWGPLLETVFASVLAVEEEGLCGGAVGHVTCIDGEAVLVIGFRVFVNTQVPDLMA